MKGKRKVKNSTPMDEQYEAVGKIIDSYNRRTDSLISILQDIQSEYHYLPEGALRQVSKILCIPLIQVYGVATFFKAFSLTPRGRHTISVCLGTACHVRGAHRVLDEFERQLGIKSGETTDDLQFTLERVNCLGACALGPIVVVDGKYYGQMNARKVQTVLSNYTNVAVEQENEKDNISA